MFLIRGNTMEKFGLYKFIILKDEKKKGWYYKIYTEDPDYISFNGTNVLRESQELFAFEGIARFAAIGHITVLENGEG